MRKLHQTLGNPLNFGEDAKFQLQECFFLNLSQSLQRIFRVNVQNGFYGSKSSKNFFCRFVIAWRLGGLASGNSPRYSLQIVL